jgi:hypothetical protein
VVIVKAAVKEAFQTPAFVAEEKLGSHVAQIMM